MCIAVNLSNEMINTLSKIKTEQERLINIVHECDLKTCDLLHEIELNDTKGMYDAWLLMKEIKEVRQIRRNAKDELRTLKILNGYTATLNKTLNDVNEKINKEEHEMKNRIYSARTDCKFTAIG